MKIGYNEKGFWVSNDIDAVKGKFKKFIDSVLMISIFSIAMLLVNMPKWFIIVWFAIISVSCILANKGYSKWELDKYNKDKVKTKKLIEGGHIDE
jgi:hypothetical protein